MVDYLVILIVELSPHLAQVIILTNLRQIVGLLEFITTNYKFKKKRTLNLKSL